MKGVLSGKGGPDVNPVEDIQQGKKTLSKPHEEEEGEDETEDREATSVEVDFNCEDVFSRVTSGRATAVREHRGEMPAAPPWLLH